ncbi:phosphotransferase enzyme family protein [Rhodoferax sp.]|uniref:phosphotransferase enzyme family protein n=1 Tax=Rhodoferax sp. TaxID=50421 RepID=UPI002ACD7409|nr:phosphotransferase [Rhodoferax sp.]MDZ7920511.1 phosphotransferase [Rhodoferax sp.]
MMNLAIAAATRWGLGHARLQFVAGRENQVYRVSDTSGDYALRLKRPGYRQRIEIESELMWMSALDRANISVPRPIASKAGHLLELVDGHQVDLLTWMPGQTLGTLLTSSPKSDIPDLFERLGRLMAQVHVASDGWAKPNNFARVAWDADGLVGQTPLWGCFWEHPGLSVKEKALLEEFKAHAAHDLHRMNDSLDYGLIHADLVRENVLVSEHGLGILDFDDGGWGYRQFDIATTLLKFLDTPNYPALKSALLQGYLGVKTLDTASLDLFLALRAVTYVGWIAPRLGEDNAAQRSRRYIDTALKVCKTYLSLT